MLRTIKAMVMMLVALGLTVGLPLALAGCGSRTPVEVGPDPTGGGGAPGTSAASSGSGGGGSGGGGGGPATRLRQITATAADGFVADLPGRLWDTERGEECSFKEVLVAQVGSETRCLPAFEWVKPGWYADAECLQRVQIQDACARLAGYVRDDAVDKPWKTCEPKMLDVLYKLGDPLPVDTVLYTNAGGPCSAQPGAIGSAQVARVLVEPVPLDAFVAATVAPAQVE